MARLIDADALIENMEMHVTTMSVCSTTIEARAKGEMKLTCISDVANAPTIDAIPVEWMRNLRTIAKMVPDDEMFIDWLIETWQEEQEAQDDRKLD